MRNIMRVRFIAVCIALAGPASADQAQDAAAPAPVRIEKPMNMDEPMETGMMKKGMMKGDVSKSAENKDEKMKEMLEKEQETMPPMPAQTPQKQ